ncbi:MAG: 23S rRNA (adenine(2503)-C(2))-methyltransferase RlmN [Candidatus Polarisedimenticolia bacterium]
MTIQKAGPSAPPGLVGAGLPELEAIVERLGERRFHARQIYRWIYARRARSFDSMTDLPASLRERLASAHSLDWPEVAHVQRSSDGSSKYLLSPPSGGRMEAVILPEPSRITFCISAQIGCALDCHFCLTAQMGFVRHLRAGEIAGQVMLMLSEIDATRAGRPVNVVMMGMGEALHNYDHAVAAVRLMVDADGIGISRRRVTLSTAGMAPGIRRLASEPVRPKLAVSLNATTDDVRSRLMPINRRYPLADLMDACAAWPLAPRERLTFEYVLLRGINDSPADPGRLARLTRRHGLKAKVNLIPFNAGGGLPYEEPSEDSVRRFRDGLLAEGVPASVRKNRGRDISAACGQLALAGGSEGGSGAPGPLATE